MLCITFFLFFVSVFLEGRRVGSERDLAKGEFLCDIFVRAGACALLLRAGACALLPMAPALAAKKNLGSPEGRSNPRPAT